jgi:hypothetical protein
MFIAIALRKVNDEGVPLAMLTGGDACKPLPHDVRTSEAITLPATNVQSESNRARINQTSV